jgi:hypothetical protein
MKTPWDRRHSYLDRTVGPPAGGTLPTEDLAQRLRWPWERAVARWYSRHDIYDDPYAVLVPGRLVTPLAAVVVVFVTFLVVAGVFYDRRPGVVTVAAAVAVTLVLTALVDVLLVALRFRRGWRGRA